MSLVRTRPGLVATIMPAAITRWTRVMGWLLVITNIGIVGTGGLVRLTGSGMGCETWPYCTEGSLTPTPEMGIHGLIEFGNRTLTGVLVIVALLAFLSVIRLRATRRELPVLSFLVGLGIIVQAVVGGITVWLHLHPSIVGLHYLISAALVALATAFLVRVYATPGPRVRIVPRAYAITTHVTTLAVTVTVVVGILLTGAGPHAGDDAAARNGLDPIFWQHVHSWPAYITLVLTLVLVAGAVRAGSGPRGGNGRRRDVSEGSAGERGARGRARGRTHRSLIGFGRGTQRSIPQSVRGRRQRSRHEGAP